MTPLGNQGYQKENTIPFWIVFNYEDPGRIEVPVGMESDVAMVCDPGDLLDSPGCHAVHGKRDHCNLHSLSPKNLIEESIRLASTLTTSTAERLSESTDYTSCSEPDLAITSRQSSASDLDHGSRHANHTYLDLTRLLGSSDSSARASGRSSSHSQRQLDADSLQEAIAEIRSFDAIKCGTIERLSTSKKQNTMSQNSLGWRTPSPPHKCDEKSSRVCIFRDLQPSKKLDAYLSRNKNGNPNGLRSCKSLGSISIDLRKLISQSRNESNQARGDGLKTDRPTVHHQEQQEDTVEIEVTAKDTPSTQQMQIVENADTLVMIPR
eukprot:jgi/Picsp_1/292/NSC_00291-R1_---NA---